MKTIKLISETIIVDTLKKIDTYHFLEPVTHCPRGLAVIHDTLGDQLLLLPLDQQPDEETVAYIIPYYVTLMEGLPFDVKMKSKTYLLHVHLGPVDAIYKPGAPEGRKNLHGEPIASAPSPILHLTSPN